MSAVVVIGGGLAGTAATITLRRAGRDVILLERERETQHKVCGEFLSAEALRYLQALGLDIESLGAMPIHSVRVPRGSEMTDIALPFAARSLTRRALDAALLELAASRGVDVQRGISVERLERDAGRRLITSDSQQWQATDVVLATGKHDLRGRPRPAGRQRGMMGLKMYFRLSEAQRAALGNSVELSAIPGGYAGLQPVEAGLANFCCAIPAKLYRKLGASWDALLDLFRQHNAVLNERMREAIPQLRKPLAVSPVPYGWLRTTTEDNLWCVGDQAAVIPSFTGDGMSIALHSGVRAAESLLRGDTAHAFHQALADELRPQLRTATLASLALARWPRLLMNVASHAPRTVSALAKATRIRERHMRA